MSYESTAEPIKIGYLMDFRLPEGFPQTYFEDLTQPFDLVFKQATEQGLLDRPIEIVYREVEGLPKGSVKAVIDAYGELCDEGCLAVFGPHITDNCVPTREAIEDRFKVPCISVTGSDEALGEWFFSFPQGSLTDEPIFWTDLLAKGGHTEVGVLKEQSLVGETYLKNFREACRRRGIRIVAEATIAQTAQDVSAAVRILHEAKAPAIVHCGFGFGVVFINPALQELNWDPPRFTSTAFQNAWINPVMWNAFMGWVGIDQYDEGNPVGQAFLDEYQRAYGRRTEWCVSVVNRDVAMTLVRALGDAHPLSPRGVKEALERVKMMPAASGAPGTRVSFGNWTRRAWMGAGYLVARRLDADGVNSHLVDRFGEE
jgi:ABC-type branched-subunit amino acid transport system substrate-binding protein